jgi:hypothetical protein
MGLRPDLDLYRSALVNLLLASMANREAQDTLPCASECLDLL